MLPDYSAAARAAGVSRPITSSAVITSAMVIAMLDSAALWIGRGYVAFIIYMFEISHLARFG